MNAKILVACLVATVGSATIANAQVGTFTIDWLANGSNAVSVNPGDIVTVTGVATWTPAAFGFGSAQFRVNLNNADATDTLTYSELLGLGRPSALRLLPQSLTDNTVVGGRTITGAGNTVVDAAQLPQMINPFFSTANPIEVFRFMFVAGNGGRTVDVGSQLGAYNVFASAQGNPAGPFAPMVDGARIEIVPTPGSVALLGVSGLAAFRRRRHS